MENGNNYAFTYEQNPFLTYKIWMYNVTVAVPFPKLCPSIPNWLLVEYLEAVDTFNQRS